MSENVKPWSIRAPIYLVCVLTVLALGTLFSVGGAAPNVSALTFLGSCCCAVAAIEIRSAPKLFRFIFWALIGHAVIGYAIANSSIPDLVSGTLDNRDFSLSFLIVSLGLMCAVFAFNVSAEKAGWLPDIEDERLVKWAKRFCLLGAALLVYEYNKLEMLPWQLDNILLAGSTRYNIPPLDEWVINRAMDLLIVTIPLLFFFAKKEKFIAVLGFVALLVTFKRAPLLSVLITAFFVKVILSRKIKPLVIVLLIAVSLYAASQIFYFGMLGKDYDPEDAARAMASGLPEVRDLGWVLWLNHDELYWGSTFVQTLPIPSIASSWVQEHSLRSVTSKLIGFERDEMGGLRITLAGEGFLNFGLIGTVIVCSLWGFAMRKVSNSALSAQSPVDAYIAALLLSWLGFWLYLAGTQASGVIKSGVIIGAVLIFLSRARVSRANQALNSVPV